MFCTKLQFPIKWCSSTKKPAFQHILVKLGHLIKCNEAFLWKENTTHILYCITVHATMIGITMMNEIVVNRLK